ncbi:Gag-Pol polyprotein [Plakobranchus ocellatus]|uniref:Gag-Pol polyprotein n=1 Tax=Plakobranchus ocellatus TaxID=259542 RepID=A0AAV3Z1K9_9GAST|nr:Gag-Pol polyprotein [Plakobranchus ocellatus]
MFCSERNSIIITVSFHHAGNVFDKPNAFGMSFNIHIPIDDISEVDLEQDLEEAARLEQEDDIWSSALNHRRPEHELPSSNAEVSYGSETEYQNKPIAPPIREEFSGIDIKSRNNVRGKTGSKNIKHHTEFDLAKARKLIEASRNNLLVDNVVEMPLAREKEKVIPKENGEGQWLNLQDNQDQSGIETESKGIGSNSKKNKQQKESMEAIGIKKPPEDESFQNIMLELSNLKVGAKDKTPKPPAKKIPGDLKAKKHEEVSFKTTGVPKDDKSQTDEKTNNMITTQKVRSALQRDTTAKEDALYELFKKQIAQAKDNKNERHAPSGGENFQAQEINSNQQGIKRVNKHKKHRKAFRKQSMVDNTALARMVAVDSQTNKNETTVFHLVNKGTDRVDIPLSETEKAWHHKTHEKVSTGKRQDEPTVASTTAGPPDPQLIITDSITGRHFLVDTGAQVSVIPPTWRERHFGQRGQALQAANGTAISTFLAHVMSNYDFMIHSPRCIASTPASLCPTKVPLSKDSQLDSRYDMAFASCKEALAEASMLSHPKHGAHIFLTTDASHQAIGGVLEQYVNGIWQPLAFFSKRLRPPEMRTSRWPEVIPLSGTSSTNCAKALIRNWMSRFGVPLDITSDRGTQFTSTLWGEIANQLGVQLHRTTAYHPQSNGLVEPQSYVQKSLRDSKFVFIRHDGHRGPLQRPYDGPFHVVAPGDKTFRVMVGEREEIISVDRLKPAHVDLTSPAQPPRRGHPPLQPAQSEPQETPEPEDLSSRPQARSTQSGRAVRLPPRFQ